MNGSNGFNVCPHCGKANSLNARFCSSCGRQLNVPDEVVICPKCHKPNSPMASYCGQCGARLKEGSQTKVCPRCGKAVDISDTTCSCGYSFGNVASPKNKSKPYKGGRIFAAIALVFLLAFAYVIFAPASLRPTSFVDFDGGIFDGSAFGKSSAVYGFELIVLTVQKFISEGFDSVTEFFGVAGVAAVAMIFVVALCLVVHILCCVVRLFTGKRSKRKNWLYFLLAILSTLGVVLWAICYYLINGESGKVVDWLLNIRSIFVPSIQTGWIMLVIPIYFWFFYIYSAIVKVNKLKEIMG